jgi:hypothetical protein
VLEKPWLYKDKWLVFPDSVFSSMDTTDCNDTISGVCYTDKSFDECVQICSDAPNKSCGAGYYVTGGKDSICVPIKTSVHEFLNPVYRLRKKGIYPSMKNLNIRTFVDKKPYPFPPDMGNAVFYEDFFALENVKTGWRIELPPNNLLDTNDVLFTKGKGLNLQILPYKNTMSRSQIYIPVRYAAPLILNIPGTNLVMLKKAGKNVGWAERILASPSIQNTFKIHTKNLENPDQLISYGAEVFITYQDLFIMEYDEQSQKLVAIYENLESAKKEGRNILFRLVPNVESYYCDNGKCKMIPLVEAETDGIRAKYKGKMVVRNPACWGMCKGGGDMSEPLSSSPNSKHKGTIALVVLSILALVAFVFCCWFFTRKK